MPRKKYGYTDDYLQFITWNYRRKVNIANPNIWAKVSDDVKRNINYVKDITGNDIRLETPDYWKKLSPNLKEKRLQDWFDIVRGRKLESLNSIAVTTYSNALRGYDDALRNGFDIIANKMKESGQPLTQFLMALPSAKDLYVAFGYSTNKRSEAKRATGDANMVVNSLKVWQVLQDYANKLNVKLPEYVNAYED